MGENERAGAKVLQAKVEGGVGGTNERAV